MDFREISEFLKDSFGYIIIIVLVFFFFFYIVAFEQVHGNSMNPNYKNQDILILSKISYKLHKIKNKDVVALTDKDGVLYIKRVIAVPGDKVYTLDNKLYINDKVLEEEYVKGITENFTFKSICEIEECSDGVIPKNKYFVLGDNREDSYDSRYSSFGLVDESHILGKVILKIWPISFK